MTRSIGQAIFSQNLVEKRLWKMKNTVAKRPGQVMMEIARKQGIKSSRQLASRLVVPHRRIKDVLRGKAPIDPELACRLSLLLGVRARFWIELCGQE